MAALQTDIKALDRIRTRLVGMKGGKSCAHSHPKSVATKPCPTGAREPHSSMYSHTREGDRDIILDRHGDRMYFSVAAGHGAKAVALLVKMNELQRKRQYTNAARVNRQISELPGYRDHTAASEAKGRKTVRRAARAGAKPNPLIKRPSDKARSKNIAKLRRQGYPPKRAEAAAYRNQREQQKRRGLAVTRKPRGVSEAREAFTVARRNVKATQGGRRAGVLRTPAQVRAFTAKTFAGQSQEIVCVVPLDLHGRPLNPKPYVVAIGQKDRVSVDMADALRPIIQTNASGAILAHQHPTGSARPSEKDRQLTARFKKALKTSAPGCAFADHLIFGGESSEIYSFSDRKMV